MTGSKRAAPSLQAPAPGPAPAYGGAYDCVVCGVSVRRTPALGCARCPCGPFHRACAPQSGPGAQTCPQCARPSGPFTGAVERAPAALGERVALEERLAAETREALASQLTNTAAALGAVLAIAGKSVDAAEGQPTWDATKAAFAAVIYYT